MNKSSSNEVKRGQAISFRVPSDTPEHLVKQLQKLKETERRNFSSKIAEFVLQGLSHSHDRERETITIPLPHKLTKAQRDWLKHEHSEALLGSIIYQLISDPIRSSSILATLNSHSIDIDEALYLQETAASRELENEESPKLEERFQFDDLNGDDDLNSLDWEQVVQSERKTAEAEAGKEEKNGEDEVEDLLGGFLASMNK
ncbi:MAG: hypothetical protein Q8935_08150 [Bacillota bacterium]|nr:hypothetical protein [Bacillota bacterium]